MWRVLAPLGAFGACLVLNVGAARDLTAVRSCRRDFVTLEPEVLRTPMRDGDTLPMTNDGQTPCLSTAKPRPESSLAFGASGVEACTRFLAL